MEGRFPASHRQRQVTGFDPNESVESLNSSQAPRLALSGLYAYGAFVDDHRDSVIFGHSSLQRTAVNDSVGVCQAPAPVLANLGGVPSFASLSASGDGAGSWASVQGPRDASPSDSDLAS